MPAIIVRRIPLPSVSLYLILSGSILMLAVMWANNTLLEEQERLAQNKTAIKPPPLMDEKNSDDNILVKIIDDPSENGETPEEAVDETSKKKGSENVEIWSYTRRTDDDDDGKADSSITFSVKRDSRNSADEPFIGTEVAKSIAAGNYSFAFGVVKLMFDEPLCLMLVVNATYCLLVVVMHVIQRLVFGDLRPIERQHMKDKFWNFVFYKFIFIFGVMNVQSLNEVLIWVSWFTAIAFLLLLTKLSKDRFEFLSFSPNTPLFYHWKVVCLLVFVLLCCVVLAISCVTSTFPFSSSPSANYDVHSITFMLAECIIIAVKAVHVLSRYGIHLYDVRHEELWERKATIVYHVDLVMELLSLLVNFVHHLHMLFSGNIWLSMASLVICMQLRFIFSEIQKRYLRHKNYRRVVANMDAQFPAATAQELSEHEDRCAICWDQMESARKLPCGHLFHAPCLRSWLEQDTTCPTCRKQLGIRQNVQQNGENILQDEDVDGGNRRPGGVGNAGAGVLNPGGLPAAPLRNHFWHFDGSRFASWLPSFSVEVTHSAHGAQAMVTTTSGQRPANEEMSNSQLDTMVRQVQDIFPQIPTRFIANDLRITGSAEATTLNIVEGNIQVPVDQLLPISQPPTPSDSQSDHQIPLVSRSEHFNSAGSTLRRRNVSSSSEPNLPGRQTTPPPSLPSEPSSSSIGFVSHNEEGGSSSTASHGNATFGRFSKAPEERERLLRSRRDMLLRQARLRYLSNKDKNQPPEPELGTNACSSTERPPSASRDSFPSLNEPGFSQTALLLEDDLQLQSGFGVTSSLAENDSYSMDSLRHEDGYLLDENTSEEDSSDDE